MKNSIFDSAVGLMCAHSFQTPKTRCHVLLPEYFIIGNSPPPLHRSKLFHKRLYRENNLIQKKD